MNSSSNGASTILDPAVQVIEKLKTVIAGVSSEIEGRRQQVWREEIESLEKQLDCKTLIAVCGATGAGKSSLMNAILGNDIVPASSFQACTAVVTEIAYHAKDTIDAEIVFISEQEWRKELKTLLRDLHDGTTGFDVDGNVSWNKVHAVYPSLTEKEIAAMSVEDVMSLDTSVKDLLGGQKHITSHDGASFRQNISPYIVAKSKIQLLRSKGSKQDVTRDASAMWPLIKQVKIWCQSPALSSGAILVDLPGVADSNAARRKIATDYMALCDHVWIVSQAQRAVDDQTARDLINKDFKMQLANCRYDANRITFILTKCDAVDPSSGIIEDLGLEEDPEYQDIERTLESCSAEIRSSTKAELSQWINELEAELATLQITVSQDQQYSIPATNDHVSVTGQKRKRSLSPESNMAVSYIEQQLQQTKTALETAQHKLDRLQRQKAEAERNLRRYCSIARSEISENLLRQSFIAELGDSGRSTLAVFSCSSVEYMKLVGANNIPVDKKNHNGDTQCFTNIDDTGIPRLQERCHVLMTPKLRCAATNMVAHFQTFIASVQTYLQDGGASGSQCQLLQTRWQSSHVIKLEDSSDHGTGIMHQLVRNFQGQLDTSLSLLKDQFRETLAKECEDGIALAIAHAVETSTKFAESMAHPTYRATLNRHGVFRRNLNAELVQPFTNTIAQAWRTLFESDLLAEFKPGASAIVTNLLKDVRASLPRSLKNDPDAMLQMVDCQKDADMTLQRLVDAAKELISKRQRTLSRQFVPYIEESLEDGYELTMLETGRGSMQRKKDVFNDFLETHSEDVFGGCSDQIVYGLGQLADTIQKTFETDLEKLARKIEVRLSSIWQRPDPSPELSKASNEIRDILAEAALFEQVTRSWAVRDVQGGVGHSGDDTDTVQENDGRITGELRDADNEPGSKQENGNANVDCTDTQGAEEEDIVTSCSESDDRTTRAKRSRKRRRRDWSYEQSDELEYLD